VRNARPAFVPWDTEVARANFGANCGPASFAAITGHEVCRSMRLFAHFEHYRWTNLTQMRQALSGAECDFVVRRRALPQHGLALIQWLGPWTKRDFFSPWSLPYTHWVAVSGRWIFDLNSGGWQRDSLWARTTAAALIAETPRAYGWAAKYGIEVVSSNSACRGSAGGVVRAGGSAGPSQASRSS
jgi:hypothetical protein